MSTFLFQINTIMKINEFADLDKIWNDIDGRMNPDALHRRQEQAERYDDDGVIAVEVKPKQIKNRYRYTNKPQPNTIQSPGFRSEQSAKRRSGHSYNPYQRRKDPDRQLPRDGIDI